MRFPFYLILYLVIVQNCFSQNTSEVYALRNDTLYSMLSLCNLKPSQAFFVLKTAKIDTLLKIIDSIECDLNSDKKLDYVYVLSNGYQEEGLSITECSKKYDKRLLLIFLSEGYSYRMILNSNVVLNTYEYQSDPFRKLECYQNGFIIKFYVGTRIRYYFDFYFKWVNNNIYLLNLKSSKYDIHKSNSGKSMQKNFLGKKSHSLKIQEMNIREFMKYW